MVTVRMVSAELTLALLVGCPREAPQASLPELESIMKRTTPPNGRIVRTTSIAVNAWGAETTWEIETTLRRERYVEFLRDQLSGWESKIENDGSLLFRRSLTGDALVISVELMSEARAVVTYRAGPD